jgi:hypothetical protein
MAISPIAAAAANFSGFITEAGSPIKNAKVTVIAGHETISTAMTNDHGVFILSVPQGTYSVSVTVPGHANQFQPVCAIGKNTRGFMDLVAANTTWYATDREELYCQEQAPSKGD